MARMTMIRCGLVVVAILAATLAPQSLASAQQHSGEALLQQVRAAWEKRQNSVRTLRVTWTTTIITPKGALTGIVPPRPGQPNFSEDAPPTDMVQAGSGEMTLDGKNARITTRQPLWLVSKKEFVTHVRESVFDGKHFTRLTRYEPGWPQASVRNGDHNRDGDDMTVWPLLAAVRGTDPILTTKLMSLAAFTQAREGPSANRRFVQLVNPRDETRGEIRLWVDPGEDYSVQRAEVCDRDGNVAMRISVTSSRLAGPTSEWLPEKWSSAMYLGGKNQKLVKQVDAVATLREINGDPGDAVRPVTFPPGTRVFDESGSKPRDYVIREDGTEREILRGETPVPREVLLRTNTGDLLPRQRSTWPGWVFRVGVVGVIVCVGLLVRRRWLRRSSATTADGSSPSI